MPERPTRREALAAGLAGFGALALAGAAPAAARGADEGRALTELLRAEEDAAFVYDRAGLGAAAAAFGEHDAEHAVAIATHVEALGLRTPGPTRGRDDLPPEALAVLEATGERARLRALRPRAVAGRARARGPRARRRAGRPPARRRPPARSRPPATAPAARRRAVARRQGRRSLRAPGRPPPLRRAGPFA